MVERLSFDAWGKRRNPDGSPDPAGAITSESSRGFTGHEQLDSVGLIHMNGRVYDPLLARFGTPDPMTENPFSTQGWNRYSYVGNPCLRRGRLPRQLQPSPQWRSLRYDNGLAVAKADTTDVDDIVKMLGSGASARKLVGAALAFLVLYATLAAPRLWGGDLAWGLTVAASIFLAAVLAASSAVDLYFYRLPDLLTVPLAVAGLFVSSSTGAGPLWWSALSAGLGFLSLAGVGYAYQHVRGRAGLGLGDAKLLGASGAWLGAGALPTVLLWAAGSALVCVLVASRRNGSLTGASRVPFGPFLGFGTWLVWLYGPL